jgi:hypothetical protein
MDEQEKRKVTKEQIEQFRQIQQLLAKISLGIIDQKRKEQLTKLALELQTAGQNKNLILQTLTTQENLTPAEQRALEAILFQLF